MRWRGEERSRRSRRRLTRAAVVIVLVAAAMAGVTTLPEPTVPDPTPEPGDAPPAPSVTVRSSTRGEVALPARTVTGGRPHDPSAGGTESVLGTDGRTDLIGRTTRYPNAAIGRVDFRQSGSSFWCTGSLVAPDVVLTAGHCVHDGLTGFAGWSTRVRFIPGAEGNRAPFGSCGAEELLALPGWYAEGREAHDLGLIRLDCRIGETVGWFGYRAVPGIDGLTGLAVHVRGYPGDQRWSTLWTMRDRVRVSGRLLAFYAADTFGGQSGSPVYRRSPCAGGRGPCVLAVHAYGLRPGRGPAARFNHGPRLTTERVALIDAVVAG